jgi:hypothetical protein
MKEELKKSLTDLIDETLLELEELKKSRFGAAEIEIKGPGEGIAGKPSNGDLHAKAEDDKKKEEDDKKKKEKDEAEKAEGQNRQADPNGGHHQVDKAEAEKAEGQNRQADPNGGHHQMDKAEDKDKKDDKKDKKEPHEDPEHEDKEKKMAQKMLDMHKGEMKKSQEEAEALMKSYVDEKVKPLEDKLSTILGLVNKIAEQPVPAKGVPANAVPLRKSAEEGTESLSKGDVASKLFELKKSGTKVDSLDITKAEMGQDLQKIAEKYKIS